MIQIIVLVPLINFSENTAFVVSEKTLLFLDTRIDHLALIVLFHFYSFDHYFIVKVEEAHLELVFGIDNMANIRKSTVITC